VNKIYEVKTRFEDGWWLIEVPEVEFGFSQAKKFRQVSDMAREVIALALEVAEDSFDIDITVVGDEAVLIDQVETLDAAASSAQSAALESKKAAIRRLTEKKIPVRDIAAMLHVSPGYVSQLSK
jgi:predicted RNase H-like HicB family nuclease